MRRNESTGSHPGRKNGEVSAAGEFIDDALQREASWYRADEMRLRLGGGLQFYGASVGAIRGTVRDALRRHTRLTRDDVTALSSELWSVPVYERRLAAVVLLQSRVELLTNSDLTRIEGFVREAGLRDLVDPLAVDVVGPLMERLDAQGRARANAVLDRWAGEPDVWLRRAALMAPLRALRAGGDWDRFARRARTVLAEVAGTGEDGSAAGEAVRMVLDELAKSRPELRLPSGA